MLIELLKEAKTGDESAKMELIQRFRPMTGSYVRFFDSKEDAFQDFDLFFLELINTINPEIFMGKSDGAFVNYMKKAVRTKFIALSKKESATKKISAPYDENFDGATDLLKTDIEFSSILSCLSPQEKEILEAIYMRCESSASIARIKGTTRQNINQIKKRALDKLRKEM